MSRVLGVSKERVRQIQDRALAKLRASSAGDEFSQSNESRCRRPVDLVQKGLGERGWREYARRKGLAQRPPERSLSVLSVSTGLFLSCPTAMADRMDKVPENVPGRFYVDATCIDCDLCRETAP